MEIRGRCVRIESRNQKTGTVELILYSYSEQREIRACGSAAFLVRNMDYCLYGMYRISNGIFYFDRIRRCATCRQESIDLLTNAVCGVSERIAKEIVGKLGDDIFEYPQIAGYENVLEHIPGIGPKRSDAIKRFLRFDSEANQLFQFLAVYEVPYKAILQVIKKKRDSITAILNNPYLLMEYDISFDICDRIAIKNKTDPWNILRINALIEQTYCQMKQHGNTRMKLNDFMLSVSESSYIPGRSTPVIPQSLVRLVLYSNDTSIIYKEQSTLYVSTKALFYHEKLIVMNLRRIQASRKAQIQQLTRYIEKAEKLIGTHFNAEQKSAFSLFTTGGVGLLTGGPGTGKTTVINGFVKIYMTYFQNQNILLCAPTGRATVRLGEITGRGAKTIHKALNLYPYGRSKTNILQYGFIIIDEMSLCDTETFSLFIQSVSSGTTVLLVGDYNQIPSVGPGQVFKDLVRSGVFPVYHLTTVMRQKEGSTIIKNASRILAGEELLEGNDFKISYFQDNRMLISRLNEMDLTMLPQVVCPIKNYEIGVNSLNLLIQEKKNCNNISIWFGDAKFYLHDKVIMNRNNYTSEYMNGDVGVIEEIIDVKVKIIFPDKVLVLEESEAEEMSLAYALSVHKLQGAECDRILIVLPQEAICMASREILYTAISRAKAEVELLAVQNVLEAYLSADNKNERDCGLLPGLIGAIQY